MNKVERDQHRRRAKHPRTRIRNVLRDMADGPGITPGHACLTPGAIYELTVRGKQITFKVTIPPDIKMPRYIAPLRDVLHDAVEKALADLFFIKRITEKAAAQKKHITEKAAPGCNHDNSGEYDCTKQPCILCLGPWNRNRK